VGLRERAQGQAITALADIEAEFGVEILRDAQIRHGEVEMVHRMDAKFSGATVRLDVTVDRRHRVSSPFIRGQATAKPRCQSLDSIHHKIFLSMENNFSLPA
jgi:hypothetical protein